MTANTPDPPAMLDMPVEVAAQPHPDGDGGPLDLFAIALTIILCLSWGLNQVAVKLALPDVPPLVQVTIRAIGATILLAIWMRVRRIRFDFRDGTLKAGLLIGLLFAVQFVLVYRGLLYTSASRSVVYLYTAPIFVVIGARWFLPSERFTRLQWAGLVLSFSGIILAFGEASPFAARTGAGQCHDDVRCDRRRRHHAGRQGERVGAGALREDIVLSVGHRDPGFGDHNDLAWRKLDDDSVKPVDRLASVPDRLGCLYHLSGLVRAGAALFRQSARRGDVSYALVWRGSRPSHP
jgi:uncharacterized membrane protein